MNFKVSLFTLFSLITFSISAICQDESPTGLIWDDEEYEQLQILDSLPEKMRSEELLKAASLKLYCPKPRDQGVIASCVGHALAHALTIEKAIKNNAIKPGEKEVLLHSASYIFNQIKVNDNCFSGASINTGLKLLEDQGDCLTLHFQNSGNSCHELPDNKLKKFARNHRIENYCAIISKKWTDKQKLENIRQALNINKPVIVGMLVPVNFKKLTSGNIDPKDWKNSKKVKHAMVIVGYDHQAKTLELMNSYGTNWGKGGFMEIPYDLVLPDLRYGYLLDYKGCN